MGPSQRYPIFRVSRLTVIFGVLFLLPCLVTGAAIDVVDDVYKRDRGVEVVKAVKGWGQCGGYEYSGSTECIEGFLCRKQHEAYHQCIPDDTKLTPTPNFLSVPTRPPGASPEPTTPFLPPPTMTIDQLQLTVEPTSFSGS